MKYYHVRIIVGATTYHFRYLEGQERLVIGHMARLAFGPQYPFTPEALIECSQAVFELEHLNKEY